MQPPENTSCRKKYSQLSQRDRDRIEALLDQSVDEAEIGRIIGRHSSTIGREIARNKRSRGDIPVANAQQYQASAADHKAYVRRQYATYQGKKIQEDDALRRYIIRGLEKHQNPDEISGAMKRERQPFYASKNTIYEWLYSEWGQPYCEHLYSSRYHPKPRKTKTEKHMIPDRVSITERPSGAADRSEYGHWEGDTVVSGKKTGSTTALVVVVERKSRFLAVRKVPNLSPANFNQAVRSIQRNVAGMHSLSLDNGIENRWHGRLSVPAYFCDPYSSWQKGSVENGNKMLRRYLPKGMDLSTVSPQKLASIVTRINNKPRKILGYKSALQVMIEQGLLQKNGLSIKNAKVALGGGI
jgi:IS30 family transposase